MKASHFAARTILVGLAFTAVAGCTLLPEAKPDPTRYFVLTSPSVASEAPTPGSLVVGLRRVQVSPYLDRGTVVVRKATNELVYNNYARWAEPLGAGITRLVQARLAADPTVARVFVESFPFDQTRDFDVAISVTRCEGAVAPGQIAARFSAIVEITTASDHPVVVARRAFSPSDQAWDGRDYAALVQALSDDIDALGTEVIAALPVK